MPHVDTGAQDALHCTPVERVGLDIQQKFSVYFSAAKTFGSETPCSLKDTHTEQRLQHSAVKPPSANQKENIYTVNAQGNSGSKSQCNHFCKNKSVCAHDCCKVGVAVGQKRSVNHETSFSSYLKDLKNRSDELVQTPVKRLKMKMNEESLAVDMQKFAYKPKETLRPGSWRGKNEYITGYVDLTAEDCAQLSDVAGLDGLEQDSSDWRIPETNGGSLRSRQLLNHSNASQSVYSNWATASSKQEALGKNVPYAPTPAVTFDLGSEWDDWDDFDDENLLRASETAVPPCKTNPEHQLQQGDEYLPGYATTSAVSCPQASLPRTAVTTPLRSISASASSVIKKFESSSNTHTFTPKRLTLDLSKKKCNIFSDGLTLKSPQMFSEQPVGAQVNRRLDFFHTTVSSAVNSSLNTSKEEEAFVGIFDGIF